jgi:hypothetical protein
MQSSCDYSIPAKPPRRSGLIVRWIVAIVVVGFGVSLRLGHLADNRFWVDEAESTINALTILQHGYPTDHYLGLPLFENTLTRPWPGSREYEFKDTSYSDRGMAVYHAWLPLYSIAASLKAFDIQPNDVPTPLKVQRTSEEMTRMQWAARLPAVVFGGLLLVALFAGGWMLYGEDAGWACLIAGALSKRLIELSQQARYYSATVLFGTICSILIWRIWRKGRWLDYVLGAVAFSLLFHTHIVTFFIACVTLAVFVPFLPRTWQTARKLAAFGAIVLAATVPWLIATGFLQDTSRIPRAYSYLRFPGDLLVLPMSKPHLSLILLIGMALMLIAGFISFYDRRRERRWTGHFLAVRGLIRRRYSIALDDRKSGMAVLIVWVAISYFSFIFLMPAISYNLVRIKLPMTGPGLILCGIVVAVVVRLIWGRRSVILSACAIVLLFAQLKSLTVKSFAPPMDDEVKYVDSAITWFTGRPFPVDTRFFTLPNRHLLLSLYLGIPVQSVAPVRKSFLDHYPGPIVLIDSVLPDVPFDSKTIQSVASAAGAPLTDKEARALALRVAIHSLYNRQAGRVASISPPLSSRPLPAYLQPLVDEQPRHTLEMFREDNDPALRWPTIFRDYPVSDRGMWWQVYFYRFSDPANRSGPNLNYLNRIRSADAQILDSGWTIYQCPPLSPTKDGTTRPVSHTTAPKGLP